MRPATGRDPDEPHRAASPLELLYDLTFVIAFGATSVQLAHAIATGHAGSGLLAFAFATFAVSWAWINYSWWASAFDTDDWFVRLMTLVQMFGVLILSIGVPDVFSSIEEGRLDPGVVVLGYVVMRLGMLALWIRVAIEDRPLDEARPQAGEIFTSPGAEIVEHAHLGPAAQLCGEVTADETRAAGDENFHAHAARAMRSAAACIADSCASMLRTSAN